MSGELFSLAVGVALFYYIFMHPGWNNRRRTREQKVDWRFLGPGSGGI
ncbi:MAG: hypothetical protein QGF68_18565 [Nitrospinota bacterium]|jgi:hypothetical protein|nr:hypothetical protein [Nitrospinota bacterium]MDP7386919.1 hypothetical protein [Nitrospinota bacterium]